MKIFIVVLIILSLFISYRWGTEKCRADYLKQSNTEFIENSNQSLKFMEKANEKVYSTAVSDIRDVLRKKYTIAE